MWHFSLYLLIFCTPGIAKSHCIFFARSSLQPNSIRDGIVHTDYDNYSQIKLNQAFFCRNTFDALQPPPIILPTGAAYSQSKITPSEVFMMWALGSPSQPVQSAVLPSLATTTLTQPRLMCWQSQHLQLEVSQDCSVRITGQCLFLDLAAQLLADIVYSSSHHGCHFI